MIVISNISPLIALSRVQVWSPRFILDEQGEIKK